MEKAKHNKRSVRKMSTKKYINDQIKVKERKTIKNKIGKKKSSVTKLKGAEKSKKNKQKNK